jgi:hypothetical protein
MNYLITDINYILNHIRVVSLEMTFRAGGSDKTWPGQLSSRRCEGGGGQKKIKFFPNIFLAISNNSDHFSFFQKTPCGRKVSEGEEKITLLI